MKQKQNRTRKGTGNMRKVKIKSRKRIMEECNEIKRKESIPILCVVTSGT